MVEKTDEVLLYVVWKTVVARCGGVSKGTDCGDIVRYLGRLVVG